MEFLLQQKYVVIDFETTGNRVQEGDQVIQVGMVTIEEGRMTDQFSSFIRPTIPIPPFIKKLTGISYDDVQSAPTLEEVLPDILKRLDQAILVAHNVHFDLSVLQHILDANGYLKFEGGIIDTVELSRILLPKQEGYKLSQLSTQLDMAHEAPHQADSDALATAQLFLSLCEKMWALPLVTVQRMVPLSQTLHSDIGSLLRHIESERLTRLNAQDDAYDIHRQIALRPIADEQTLEEEPIPDLDATSFDLLVGPKVPGYRPREGQLRLYEDIYDCFREGKHGLFEAGTGTGKTLSYLGASILQAKKTDQKVIVSTHTIPLQEQIMHKELPVLQKALPFSFKATVMKGKHHYLCLNKFEQALLYPVEKNYDHDLTKMQLLVWLTETETGDVEELNLSSGGKDFWESVKSEGHNCFQKDCPWYKRCFYYKARERAQQADLVITNHALLLTDQVYGQGLPAYRYALIDEAHHFHHVATEQFGQRIAYANIHSIFQRLAAQEKKSLSDQLYDIFQLLLDGSTLSKQLDDILFTLHELKEHIDYFFDQLQHFVSYKGKVTQDHHQKVVRIQHQNEEGEAWVQILQQITQCVDILDKALQGHARMVNTLEKQDMTHQQKQIVRTWQSTTEQLEHDIRQVYAFFLEATPTEEVHWVQYDRHGNRYFLECHVRPLHVDQVLWELFFSKKQSVVLTSATLQVNQSFDYMIHQLGLQHEVCDTAVIPSPFSYRDQVNLVVPNDIRKHVYGEEKAFAQDLAQSLIEMASVSKGRMLVLFTSYRLLQLTHRLTKEPLQDLGIFLYAQGVDSGSRTKLTKNFQREQQAVLFGTYSFWEGIDIPGEDLSCLVIVKLPFTPPGSPYEEAKGEQLKADGYSPFKDLALPQAVLRFKQGFGRLIRKETDEGVVVVFDRRLIETHYGRAFTRSLPDIDLKVVSKDSIATEILQRLG
ncbi:ATP-dependent DNA helicase DinG [Caldalkalibacillus salinus]|uniref:ATP-dependent DNA helicase DinG n=1 Tax=Caldalkalibacillus salinus TaxID=2803787 RepID=UPI0019219904|nr:ATP-dependent DNA helicase DinG [Caldalkalibacillus salinus]